MNNLIQCMRHPSAPSFALGGVFGFFIDRIWLPLVCIGMLMLLYRWYRKTYLREDS